MKIDKTQGILGVVAKFRDGGEDWIPNMKIRDLEIFTDYPELAIL